MDRAASLAGRHGGPPSLRRVAADAPGAGGRRNYAGRWRRHRAAACFAHRPRHREQRRRSRERPRRPRRARGPHLVRPGHLARRLRAVHDHRLDRDARRQWRHHRGDQSEADLGCRLDDPCRSVGRGVRARPIRSARRAPRYQPRAARRRRSWGRAAEGAAAAQTVAAGGEISPRAPTPRVAPSWRRWRRSWGRIGAPLSRSRLPRR